MVVPATGQRLHRATTNEFIGFIIAYLQLLLARWAAAEHARPSNASGVSLPLLRAQGVTDDLVLWMLYQSHIAHLHPGRNGDRESAGNLRFTDASIFCLTDLGEAFGNQFVADALVAWDDDSFTAAWDLLVLGMLVPAFDVDNRMFRWGAHVLKCFRQPSVNQELILRAAEELHWPCWFDDPLPRNCGINAKTRLHDTIKGLNRRQHPYLVHFKGDGTGTRVGWEYR